MDIEQKRERLAQVSAEAKRIYKAAEDTDRDLTQEEAGELDRLLTEAKTLRREVQAQELDDWLSQPQPRKVHPPKPVNLDTPTDYYQPISFPQRSLPDPIYVDQTGRPVYALSKQHSFANYALSKDQRFADLSLGHYIKGMLVGTHDPQYRAALVEGQDTAGGYLMPEVLAGRAIDLLRAQSVATQAGASTIPLSSGINHIARLESDPSATWHSEAQSDFSAQSPTFGRITLTPKTLICLIKISRELLEDAANASPLIENALASALALELDRAALVGDGGGQEPRGVMNHPDINTVTVAANGAALTSFDKLVDGVYETSLDNAPPATGFVMHPRTARDIAKLADSQNQPLMKPAAIAEIPFYQSTQIPIDQTLGSGTDLSSILVGHWPHLLIGMRTQLMIQTLTEKYSDEYSFGLQASLRADIALEHAESFCWIKGVDEA